MLLVGLTGGIGSGKSSVSSRLAARGAAIIDADAITRALQEPGQPVFDAIVEAFGSAILTAEGTLDRAAVADVVFNDAAAKARLEGIVHPEVGRVIAEQMAEHQDSDRIVVLDVPLLVESGRSDLAALIVVTVPVDLAVSRLVEHRGFREHDVRARIRNQATDEERRSRADLVIDNSGTVEDLDHEVDRCWAWLERLRDGTGPTATRRSGR